MNRTHSPAGNHFPRTILHVTECYEGGVSRAIRSIVRLMSQDVHLLLGAGKDLTTDANIFESVTELPRNPAQAIEKIQKVTRISNPDVVHAHSSWGGFYTRTIRLPSSVVYQPHCYAFEAPNRSWLARAAFWGAEYIVSHRTSNVLALSQREKNLALRLNSKIPVHLLPNIPTLPLLPPEVSDSRSYRKSIYMIGRVTLQKDPKFFITVANQVRQRTDDTEFVWIGDGEKEQVEELKKAGVRVTGWLSADALTSELSSAGVYLHTASYEGFPLSVLDAASQGVPIIARRIPCFAGTPLLQAQSPKELAGHLIAVLNDRHTRSSVVNHGYKLLESMNEQAQKHALNIAYENARN